MRRALWRKGRRDLGSRRGSSVLLVLVVALATVGIVAGVGQQAGAERKWDHAFAPANGAHLVLYDKVDPAPAAITDDPAVAAADRQVPQTRADLVRGTDRLPLTARGTGSRIPTIGTPLHATGRWLGDGADYEVVVDRSVALSEGIRDGDQLTLSGPGGQVELRVVGTALDLIDCFNPQWGSAPVWVSPTVVQRLDPNLERGGYLLPLRLHDPEQVGTVGARLQRDHGDVVDGLNDWQDTRKDALSTNRYFSVFPEVFVGCRRVAPSPRARLRREPIARVSPVWSPRSALAPLSRQGSNSPSPARCGRRSPWRPSR